MLDSSIGYTTGTLSDSVFEDSLIGFVVGLLYDPSAHGDSLIGYASGILSPPHHPIGTWDGTTIIWHKLSTWNGSELV